MLPPPPCLTRFVAASVTTIASCPAVVWSIPVLWAIEAAARRASATWLVSDTMIAILVTDAAACIFQFISCGQSFPADHRDFCAFSHAGGDMEFVREPFRTAQTQTEPAT